MTSKSPVSERLRAKSTRLTGASVRVAEVVRRNPDAVLGMTISDLAERSDTSVGSVVRFAQDLGFRGFQDLKLQLAGDLSATPPPAHDELSVPARVLAETGNALNQAAAAVDQAAFDKAVDVLLAAGRILVSGVGTSLPVATDAAYRLQLAGLPTLFYDDNHRQHVAASLLGPADVCLTVSHTGQTQETLAVTEAAREAGARTVAITSYAHSPLTQLCDVVLVAGSAETDFRVEAMTSRFVHLAIVDGLFVAVSEAQPGRAEDTQAKVLGAVAKHRL